MNTVMGPKRHVVTMSEHVPSPPLLSPKWSQAQDHLGAWDYAVVVVYFLIIIITGIIAMRRSNRSTVSGYFLAGRFMTWLPVGASVFASNIGSEHFIGLAGSGASSGISVAAFEINVCTLPGYISKRFGGTRIQTYLAVLSMLLYIFTKISVNLFSGAIFIQQTIGWNMYLSICILLAITSLCTVTGGLTAVIYTETAQSLIMIIGSGTVAIKGLIEIGGFDNLYSKYMAAIPSVIPANMSECAMPKDDSFLMLRSLDDPDMPWLGFLMGQTPASIWYWCADQMMVQRLLAAKSLSHAQGGALLAGFLKILPIFLIVLPGMISRILYTDEIACVDPEECMRYCNNPTSCANTAYPRLVLGLMPSPLKGLLLSVMLAALMSDLSSIFNSSSTLFTCDIWPRIRKNASVVEQMIVGRAFVLVMVGISIAWVPVIQNLQNGQLYLYIQDAASNLAPPIAAVYILAIVFKRINEPGAFWSLMVGLLIGITRLILNLIYMEPACGQPDLRPVILQLHYMYFAIFLFWTTVLICTVISLLTDPPKDYLLIRTTYWTRFDEQERFDEKEEEMKNNGEASKTVVNGNYIDNMSIESEVSKPKQSLLRRFATWFCGIKEASTDSETVNSESKANIASIEQNRTAKTVLFVSLCFVICVAVAIFIVLSLPGWWNVLL